MDPIKEYLQLIYSVKYFVIRDFILLIRHVTNYLYYKSDMSHFLDVLQSWRKTLSRGAVTERQKFKYAK